MNVIIGLDELQFIEFDRKNIFSPILDARDFRQFLKFVGNAEILKLTQIQIDSPQRTEDISLTANLIQDGV